MSKRRIGVFICRCGGNISDYVEVDKVRQAVENDPGVVVAKTQMFACSDAAQEEIVADIAEYELDGIVIASCSPTLHLLTFRAMAERASLNPYCYSQSNIREQCSWAHRRERPQATDKAIRIVRSGIARTRLSEELTTLRINTEPTALVVGAGVAGLSAALTLGDMGLEVFVIERDAEVGGWTKQWSSLFPNEHHGPETVEKLHERVLAHERITLFTRTELVEKTGTVGDFIVRVRVTDGSTISLHVGAIIVATGFSPYDPADGELGRGHDRVVTLPEYERILAHGDGPLSVGGRRIGTVAYIYCVGSRQGEGSEAEHPRLYCSRYCCSGATHAAILAHERDPELNQYHLYRDIRTYGKHELLYEKAGRTGSVFIRFDPETPPEVREENGELLISVTDALDGGEEVEIPADLVVLVTGMVPRENSSLVDVLKLPVGTDGFFNEIHPKLRPVETVIDGVFICGTAQGPKTIAESVASSLAAVSKAAALLMKGYVDLDPHVATVDTERCTWCDECAAVCPYDAIEMVQDGTREVARIMPALCKGGGPCVPVCPEGAIDLRGYTDQQVTSMIDAMLAESALSEVG